jgi:hypothetical protein
MSNTPLLPESNSDEQQLCVRCLAPNYPSAHFCVQCSAPLSGYASTGPFEQVFAQGAVYREAAQHPKKLIVVIGVWLIFGMMFLGGAFLAGYAYDLPDRVGGAFLLTISLLMIWRTTWNYRARMRPPPDL